jgi:hypothetical protein
LKIRQRGPTSDGLSLRGSLSFDSESDQRQIREAMSSQPSINTRQFLETLVGQTVFTIDRGDWNRVDRMDGSDVVVATRQSPGGAAYRSRYKLWNRFSSGSYFPPPVRAVEIPKRSGGSRVLGVPTVAGRIAQTVVAAYLEPEVEPHFHPDSYGYRPGRSALDAGGGLSGALLARGLGRRS